MSRFHLLNFSRPPGMLTPKPMIDREPSREKPAAGACMPRLRATSLLACMAVASLLTQSGCSSIKVGLGMRVNLDKTPVASIQANLPNGPGIAPGQTSPLVVTVTQPDGKDILTEGKGGGKVQWKDLNLSTSIVAANQKGILALSGDPRISDGKVGHVTVTVPSHPDVHAAELDVHFRYDVAFVSNFSGASGESGMDGAAGEDGTNGSSGSVDPNSPSPGGDGTNGGNGGDGQSGGDGGNAPPVQVLVARQPGIKPLLQVSVSALGNRRLYLVDPYGGSLTVRADGGLGGSGGKGGRGGHGGSGGLGSPNGRDGGNGYSGRNGSDGSPGKGGLITVTSDPQVKLYLGAIHLSSKYGPPPVLRTAPVAPLW
jgi:hypothetical protein